MEMAECGKALDRPDGIAGPLLKVVDLTREHAPDKHLFLYFRHFDFLLVIGDASISD